MTLNANRDIEARAVEAGVWAETFDPFDPLEDVEELTECEACGREIPVDLTLCGSCWQAGRDARHGVER